MRKKRILSLVLILILLCGASYASAAQAGSAGDPLITQSYVDGAYTDSVMSTSSGLISSFKSSVVSGTASAGDASGSGGVRVVATGQGGSISMSAGSSVILLSGDAVLQISSGSVLNMTAGTEAASGTALQKNNKYIVSSGASASVSASVAIIAAVEGDVYITAGYGKASPFLDVRQSDWFFDGVTNAVELGMINGRSATIYDPYSNLSIAETMKLAACIHQNYYTGTVTLSNGAPWYQTYVNYCRDNGIISKTYENYDAKVTRAEFVHIFYSALPSSSYTAINSISDGSIPDIGASSAYAGEIYTFYRAGILTGDTATATAPAGTFRPNDAIKRSEVAVLLNRMYDASTRKTFSLS